MVVGERGKVACNEDKHAPWWKTKDGKPKTELPDYANALSSPYAPRTLESWMDDIQLVREIRINRVEIWWKYDGNRNKMKSFGSTRAWLNWTEGVADGRKQLIALSRWEKAIKGYRRSVGGTDLEFAQGNTWMRAYIIQCDSSWIFWTLCLDRSW